jgi:hypothetical protein
MNKTSKNQKKVFFYILPQILVKRVVGPILVQHSHHNVLEIRVLAPDGWRPSLRDKVYHGQRRRRSLVF